MPSDIVLEDEQVKVIGARHLSVGSRDETTNMRVTGWVRVESDLVAPELAARELTVGLGTPTEPKDPGALGVVGRTGEAVFEVDARNVRTAIGSREAPGQLWIHMPDQQVVVIGHGRVQSPLFSGSAAELGHVVIGAGAPGEETDPGSLQVRDRDGSVTFAVDGATGQITAGPLVQLLERLAALEQRVADLESRPGNGPGNP